MTTAAELLGAVRGRRLCYELAANGPGGDQVRRAMFDEAFRVCAERGDVAAGSVRLLVAVAREDGGDGAPGADDRGPTPDLVAALAALDAAETVRTADLLAALAATVSTAMYWQPPDGEDVVLAGAAVRAALRPVAEALLDDPGVAWWTAPLDRATQVRTRFDDVPAGPGARGTADERLRRWRQATLDGQLQAARERARHPEVALGGAWWVTPALVGLDVTTRDLADRGSVALWLTEDALGWTSADLVPCTVGPARVLEIGGPADWAALVERHPLEVTASRQPDWYGALEPRPGRWLIPDWAAVAAEFDGVHVSVMGWLTTAGRALSVGPDATTTLAGWDPDATWWLADVVQEATGGRPWVRDDDGWRAGP